MSQTNMSDELKKELGFIPWEPCKSQIHDPWTWLYVDDIADIRKNRKMVLESAAWGNIAINKMIDSVK